MCDLETLGNHPGSVITTIGAVAFDIITGTILDRFSTHISIDDSLQLGLKMNASTVLWWLEQDEAARKILTEGQKTAQILYSALAQFSTFVNKYGGKDAYLWGRSPRFDLGLLHDAYRVCGINDIPWDFRKELDVRTMEWLRPQIKKDTIRTGTAHDAIADCEHQIKYVCEIWKDLNLFEEQQHLKIAARSLWKQ